ncbi:unnamed protein product [marine sediment metagenome]|uniref:Carrier domain-containing protein n=1 Tax=marine sediment metagenome TaxID=412755 RepID=X0YHW0_9ZZZZ
MTMLEKVQEGMADILGMNPKDIKAELSICEGLAADSLDTVEMVMWFEEDFGMEFPDDEVEKLKTVADVVEYLTVKGCEA